MVDGLTRAALREPIAFRIRGIFCNKPTNIFISQAVTLIIMREIGKDGKVWRLTKVSWEFLLPFDSDPNVALKKIQAKLSAQPAPTAAPHGCNFDEKKLGTLIRDTMEEVLKPFTGG